MAFLTGQNAKDLSVKIQTSIHYSIQQGFINQNTAIVAAQSDLFWGH
jgi:hypothetical protein